MPKPLPRDLRLAIFDLDGTLVDAYQAIADSLNVALSALGLKPQRPSAVKRAVGWGVDSLIRNFVDEDRAEEGLALFRDHHDRRLRQNIRLLPGAKGLLKDLKTRGMFLAIASNRPARFCRIILDELGIVSAFDRIICGDNVPRPKPWPDMLQRIVRELKVRPSQAIYVGDMTVDVLSARRARIFSVAVPTGSCTIEEIRAVRPDRMIARLTDLRVLMNGRRVLHNGHNKR
ncbi:MAG: HAD family hydrolase [Elusimicrobia bacterium]|nr:HAD family hydrolase [Elusimicrobiota bacterium]